MYNMYYSTYFLQKFSHMYISRSLNRYERILLPAGFVSSISVELFGVKQIWSWGWVPLNLDYFYFFVLLYRISSELELPSLPEMVFGDNVLQIDHAAGFGIQFNALDALKLVDNRHDLMKVAVAEEWQSKRWSS